MSNLREGIDHLVDERFPIGKAQEPGFVEINQMKLPGTVGRTCDEHIVGREIPGGHAGIEQLIQLRADPFGKGFFPLITSGLLQLTGMPMVEGFTGNPGGDQSGLAPILAAAQDSRQRHCSLFSLEHRLPRSANPPPAHEGRHPAHRSAVNRFFGDPVDFAGVGDSIVPDLFQPSPSTLGDDAPGRGVQQLLSQLGIDTGSKKDVPVDG